jgi:hypothetical protein
MVLTPTKAEGARSLSTVMTEVPLEQSITLEELEAFAPGSGLNGRFLSNTLSGFLAHEQCGVHLYRTVAGATAISVLQQGYLRFLEQTERHVAVLEQLITRLGGDPLYVSPTARAVHAMNTHLMAGVVLAAGSAEPLDREAGMLEAVLLAETKDHGDWTLLVRLAADLGGEAGDALRDAVREVMPDEDEHVEWSRSTWEAMAEMQAHSGAALTIADFTEKAFPAR